MCASSIMLRSSSLPREGRCPAQQGQESRSETVHAAFCGYVTFWLGQETHDLLLGASVDAGSEPHHQMTDPGVRMRSGRPIVSVLSRPPRGTR